MQTDLFSALTWEDALLLLRDNNLLRDLDVAIARFLNQQCPQASYEVLLLAAFTSNQQASGHLCLDLKNRQLATQLWGTSPPPELVTLLPGKPDDWLHDLRQSPLVSQDGNTPLVLDGSRLYLRRNWAREVSVAEAIDQRLATVSPLPVKRLRDALTRLFPSADDQTDWQQVACALASRSGIGIITGGPGTGKTTTVVRLLGLLQSLSMASNQRLRIRLAAPTGKAAARLTESIGEQVQQLDVVTAVRDAIPTEVTTLHRLLGTRPDSRHFRHHADNPLHADLVVVDEASMIDMDMMARLLEALSPHTRLILLGDKDQLASVEAGAVMGDLCRHAHQGRYKQSTIDFVQDTCGADISNYQETEQAPGNALAQQTAMLRTNWRSKDSPGIGELARAVNEENLPQVRKAFQQYNDSLHRHPLRSDGQQLETQLLNGSGGLRALFNAVATPPTQRQDFDGWAAGLLKQLTHQQLLSGLRSGPFGVEQLNQRITRHLQQQDLAPEREWYPGRPVMMTRNDYQLGLMNGDVGLTLPLLEQRNDKPELLLRVAFQLPDGRIKWVLPSRLDGVETVYAMTVHKSQGSEFRHTLLVLPDAPHPLLTRELIYTAVTRARDRFTLLEFGKPAVLDSAVKKRTWRASGLAERLFK
ncbi:exodeoxyribonuclease V subunit alpha [Alcanivorax jadensis T9]|jgi:exodeoxyribonuclease V alpha subunit|uniref:RecBCD enzyme subunit RecD n=1 Tax=Alcanivorax jadensis T9 TaxID=1177181 RepID=A0ABR4WDY1_9GAMM|nr:exodeoxyribonuclease V subunit alpha [Alcanivorax jadensis]KGD61457.1 exodeoxyribonuclease V subunit alpha [Alcanivorax jadensis T9]MBP21529.1 exodeoxyribonuclease V subunit alpha [Alcanivorax sp.]